MAVFDDGQAIYFITEDGTKNYVTEDGASFYILALTPTPPVKPPKQEITSNTYIVRDRWGTGWTASRYRTGYSNG